MFKRYWIIAAAFGLALSTSGQAQEQAESAQGKAGEQSQPSYDLPLPFPVEIIEDQAATDARNSRENESQNNEIADLEAQQGMNAATQAIKDATLDMRDYALASTVAVWVGTALLFYTLWLSRSANNAAHTAVRVTREIGEAQTRAYIGMDNLTASVEPGNTGFQLYAKFFNQGQTPAREVYWQAQFYTAQEFSEEVWGNLAEPIYRGSIPVADESYIDATISTSSGDSRKDIDDVFSGDQHVFFAYHLRYQSIFGVKEFESFGVSKLIRSGDDGWAFAAVPTERKDT